MRVSRTFADLRLAGYEAFVMEHHEERAAQLLGGLLACVRSATAHHGVRVVRWQGPGVILSAFGAWSGLRCAIEIRDQVGRELPLALHGGVTRGEVIMLEGEDPVGRAIMRAAQLRRSAEPHALMVEEHLLRHGMGGGAIALRGPVRASSSAPAEGLFQSLDDHGLALAAADAHRLQADGGVALA